MNRDFVEMLCALSETGAEFIIVGAHALAAHGHPRATGDLDIWIRPGAENAGRVLRALRKFGAPLLDLTQSDLIRPGTVFQIGTAPSRIDILTTITGVSWEQAWPEVGAPDRRNRSRRSLCSCSCAQSGSVWYLGSHSARKSNPRQRRLDRM